jgi:hypothetical protein
MTFALTSTAAVEVDDKPEVGKSSRRPDADDTRPPAGTDRYRPESVASTSGFGRPFCCCWTGDRRPTTDGGAGHVTVRRPTGSARHRASSTDESPLTTSGAVVVVDFVVDPMLPFCRSDDDVTVKSAVGFGR